MSEHIKQDFFSVVEWLEFLKSPTDAPEGERASMRAEENNWTQTSSLEEAIKLAEDGWNEGVERIEQLSAKLSEELVTMLHTPEVHFDVTGDMLDVGRYVNGEPEDFMSLVPAEIETHPKILHLGVNITANWNVGGETMIRKGAAVVALIDTLEQHGKRIEVDCIGHVDSEAGETTTTIRVKDSNAPVQLANLVYLLAHPSTLRRLLFCSWEHLPEEERRARGFRLGGSYGRAAALRNVEAYDIYIPETDRWSEDQVMPWLISKLSDQGIYIEKEEVYG